MSSYHFYYDETEHSRKTNINTLNAEQYYDNFITLIVGWDSDNEHAFLKSHADFENKYAKRKSKGELKSTTLKQKFFSHGFASLCKSDVTFIDDFLSLFDDRTHFYLCASSKIEYVILQLFGKYRNKILPEKAFLNICYIIIKALVMYHPKEVIECLNVSPQLFLEKLKSFFLARIEYNRTNIALKYKETQAFEEALLLINGIDKISELNWEYNMPFEGFNKYLQENNITNYVLVIDKEGKDGDASNTLKAAQRMGLLYSEERDSLTYPGIRIADMMAGIIAKLFKALHHSLRYESINDSISKKLLSVDWFNLDNSRLKLYKKLHNIICVWKPSWHKTYSGIYSDDFVIFVALLDFMNQFNSADEINRLTQPGEMFNTQICSRLYEYFTQRFYT